MRAARVVTWEKGLFAAGWLYPDKLDRAGDGTTTLRQRIKLAVHIVSADKYITYLWLDR